jgi:predicted metalloprotease
MQQWLLLHLLLYLCLPVGKWVRKHQSQEVSSSGSKSRGNTTQGGWKPTRQQLMSHLLLLLLVVVLLLLLLLQLCLLVQNMMKKHQGQEESSSATAQEGQHCRPALRQVMSPSQLLLAMVFSDLRQLAGGSG